MSAAPTTMNPFPGLRPFTQDEDYLFFGREEQTIELLQRLGNNRFVAVVGTSGSGKSSLVRCGLLSQLLGGKMLEAGASWEIAVTHPGGNPLALLTDALLEAGLYDREQDHARENLLATLSRSHFGLVEAVKQADLGEGTNFLLVVDQFEEIFRFHEAGQTQQEAANEFVSLLLEAAAQKEVPIYVVLTMRSDFIGECGQFEGLAEMVNRGEFLIPRLTREQYKRVIEGPIKVAGGQIAPRLLQRLLNDLGQQADQLPCLQHALMRTWNVWAGNGHTDALDFDDYHRVGKMSQALSLHADEIYESLASDRQRALCQEIFQALTVEESNSRGIRRPQRLGRLCQILEAPADELQPIIDAYRQSGVTFLMPSPEVELTGQTIIDISHESLMRVWTRLRQWVEEETQAAGIYHRLSESADLHERGKAGLYRDPELGIALAWRESKRPNAAWAERYHTGFATAIKFLEASQQASVADEQSREAARQRELEQAQQLAEAQQLRLEHQQRAARKLRMMIGGLAVVAIVAVLACALALVSNKRANDLAVVAKQKSAIAEKSATEADRQRALAEAAEARAKGEAGRARTAEQEMRRQWYAASINLMQPAWDTGQVGRLRALLAETEAYPDRGFEWSYWQRLCHLEQHTLIGHRHEVTSVAWLPDGTRLATGSFDGTAKVWDAAGGRELLTLKGHTGLVLSVAWSPDGTRLATGSSDRTAKVWKAAGGRELLTLRGHMGAVGSVAWSPDGTRLATGSSDGTAKVWKAAGGRELLTLRGHTGAVGSVSWSPDGTRLATGSDDGTAKVWEAAGGRELLTLTAHTGGVNAVSWSPDGTRLTTGNDDGIARVWDATGGRELLKLKGHAEKVSSVSWSPDGTRLATGSNDGTAKVWDAAGGRELLTLRGHASWVWSVTWSPDGTRLATGSEDTTARVWDAASGRELLTLRGHVDPVYSVPWSPDGQRLATGSWDTTAKVWDAAGAEAVRRWARQDRAAQDHTEPGQPEDAAAAFAKLLKRTPESQAAALIGLAEQSRKAGRLEQARQFWEKVLPIRARAVAQRPDDGQAWRDLGTVHAALGQPEEAAAAFTKLVKLTPESHRAVTLMGLAELDQKAGRPDRARQWWAQAVPLLTRAVAQRPDDRQAWRDLGTVHAELGQPEAAAAFTKLVELTPESYRAVTLIDLAELDQKAGRPARARQWWAQAVPLLTRAVAQRPDDRQAWKELSIVRAELGQPEAATAVARLMELTPESQRAATLMDLAELDQKAGRPERAREWWAQAISVLTRSVAQRPDDRQAWRELGIVRAELGQPEAAAAAFTKLMELTPHARDENLWWSEDPAGIGEALAAHDEIFGRVVRARPRDRTLLIARCNYFGRRRRWREAAEMAARIIAVDPEAPYAPDFLRALLLFSGDLEGYRRACSEAVAALKERNPNGDGWLEMLGQFEFPRADETGPPPKNEWESLSRGFIDYREGRYAGAIRHLTEVTRSSINPFARTSAHLFLAMANHRLGHEAEARRELDAARKPLDGLGGVYGAGNSSGGGLMNYGWTEWVRATIVLREAEALIVYDPIFPADPFAR